MRTAKVFSIDGERAILMPPEFRIDVNEVYLHRTPEVILISIRDPWEVFLEGVAELSDNFFAAGRDQLPPHERSL